ncbi:MAG: hypothetical protein WA118_09395 [Carboxydocellales bacterium]
MPTCKVCGNTTHFGCSQCPPEAPEANGPASSLMANFDQEGYLDYFESLGAEEEITQHAWEDPQGYFDMCMECGSNNVEW